MASKKSLKGKATTSKRQHASTIKNGSTDADECAAAANIASSIRARRGTEHERPDDKKVLRGAEVILRPDDSDETKAVESMTRAEVEAEINDIENKIEKLGGKIQENETVVCGILHDSVRYAKQIGELLCRARELLPHGKYQEWVEDNFYGSPATARAYKRIAEFRNWSKIQARLTDSSKNRMSIRDALSLIQKKEPEPPLKYEHDSFLGQIEKHVFAWPGHVCQTYAGDFIFMEKLCKIVSLVCDEYRRETEEERKRNEKDDKSGLKAFARAKLKREQERREEQERWKKDRDELDDEIGDVDALEG